jgi:hypothetical protein
MANIDSGTIEQVDYAIHWATREYLMSPSGACFIASKACHKMNH